MQVWCDWQVKLFDPHLSALEVRFSRRGAIQIYVYLYLVITAYKWDVKLCSVTHSTNGSWLHSLFVSSVGDELLSHWWFLLNIVAAARGGPSGDGQSDSQHGTHRGTTYPELQREQERPGAQAQSYCR